MFAPRKQHSLQNAVICEESFGKNNVLYAHLTYKDVERFQNGSVQEFCSLETSQIGKVPVCPHEITNEPYMGPNYENNEKTLTQLLT